MHDTEDHKANNENLEENETLSPEEEATPGLSDKEVSDLIKQINTIQQETEEYKDKYYRAHAELENYKKRVNREKDELRKYGNSLLIESLLPVLDSLGLALQSTSQENANIDNLVKGLDMVMAQFSSLLKNFGIEEIDPVSEAFNPNLHECNSLVHNDEVEENHVIQVIRKGYSLHGRLLRPAFVIVSRGKESEEKAEEE